MTQTAATHETSSETTTGPTVGPTKPPTTTVETTTLEDFHQTNTSTAETSTTLMLGNNTQDLATRVAFTVHQDPQWWVTLATDLDPIFAEVLATTRNPDTSGDSQDAGAVLVLISVDEASPGRWFVSFDVETSDTSVGERHVTAITINPATGLVTDVEVLA